MLSVTPASSTFDPTALEQELMEHLNRIRLDPQGELDTLFTSVDPLVARDPDANDAIGYFLDPTSEEIESEWASLLPVAPLIWNESLHESAIDHSLLMAQYDQQSHQFPNEPGLMHRVSAAGYEDDLGISVGENVFAYANTAFHTHSAFAIDWAVPDRGHRVNLMAAAFREVGIGIVTDYNYDTQVGPLIVTQDFGVRSTFDQPHLLGVVFGDLDGDGWYDSGEGLGNVTVEIEGTDASYTVTSMSAGGYQVEVEPGVYTLTAQGGGLAAPIIQRDIVVGVDNVKVDFFGSTQPNQRPLVDLNGPGQSGSDYSTSFSKASGPAHIVDAGSTVTDADNKNLVSATVTIADLLDVGAEILGVDTGATAIGASFNQFTGVLRLTGSASVADYQQVMRTLSYYNGANVPTGTSRSMEVTVNDGFDSSGVAVSTVSFAPGISVDDVMLAEGHYGTTIFAFSVNLSVASDLPVAVSYRFIEGTARSGSDYLPIGGQVTFAPGQSQQTVNVAVIGDTAIEEDEHFYVSLYNAQNAFVADSQALVTIVDDDTAQDMGILATAVIENLNPSAGEILLTFHTLNRGMLSLEALFDGPVDTVGMVLYDGFRSQQPLAVSSSIHGNQRIDWQTEADTSYYLAMNGSAEDVALRMVNLVDVKDGTVVVHGSDGDDRFEFDAADGYRVTVNGARYDYDPAAVYSIEFDTGAGSDTVVLRDSSGDETLTAGSSYATFSGNGFTVSATGFEVLLAYAKQGGHDVASLSDSPGNDYFKGYPELTKLYGGGYFLRAKAFDVVRADASGGYDYARFFDSDGNDTLVTQRDSSRLYGPGFDLTASGYDKMLAYADTGNDVAHFMDSPANDVVRARSHKTMMWSGSYTDPDYLLTARRFDEIHASAAGFEGDFDIAKLHDTPGDDQVQAEYLPDAISRAAVLELSGAQANMLYEVLTFDQVNSYRTTGNDTKDVAPDAEEFLMFREGWE